MGIGSSTVTVTSGGLFKRSRMGDTFAGADAGFTAEWAPSGTIIFGAGKLGSGVAQTGSEFCRAGARSGSRDEVSEQPQANRRPNALDANTNR